MDTIFGTIARGITWEYISGFFDGEGFIGIYSRDGNDGFYKNVRVIAELSNTHKETIDIINNFLLSKGVKSRIVYKKKIGSHNQVYSVMITNHKSIIKFCENIKDFCFVKRKRIIETLDFCLNRSWYKKPKNIDGRKPKPLKICEVLGWDFLTAKRKLSNWYEYKSLNEICLYLKYRYNVNYTQSGLTTAFRKLGIKTRKRGFSPFHLTDKKK